MDHSHRPGSLKQVNKSHKQSKASKRSVKIRQGGRVENVLPGLFRDKVHGKKDRANLQKQIRENKRKEFLEKRNSGAGSAFPSVVALVPLAANVDTRTVLRGILDVCADCDIRYSSLGNDGLSQPVTIVLTRHKRRLTFLCCTQNLENVLDTCSVADLCVFVANVADGEEASMNPQADLILTSLRTQGLPTSVGLIQNLESLSAKQKTGMKKYATRLFQSELGVDVKVFDDQHLDQLLRSLCDTCPSVLHWRQMRSYLLAEEVGVNESGIANAASPTVDLCVRGYLHGAPLSLYDLIHISGEGSHLIKGIRILPDPSPLKKSHGDAPQPQELVPDLNRIHPIEEENAVDPNSVQAPHWQSPEVADLTTTINNTEAIWREVVGDELYEDEEDRRAHEALMALDEEMALDDEMSEQEDFDVEDYEDFNRQNKESRRIVRTGKADRSASPPEEERKEEEEEYWEAPDQQEVPFDQPARYRFLKYRGLQSFRSSPWDPKENLPIEYASLFQFEDYNALLRSVAQEQDVRRAAGCDWEHELEDGTVVHDPMVEPGAYVEILVADVSRAWIAARQSGMPVVLSALLPHEEKLTVMHGSLQRSSTWYPQTVKSRDLLLARIGFRRVLIHPLFADTGIKCDKSKYVKYLPPTGFFTCTFYAPLSYRPCPLLLFKPRTSMSDDLTLVGIGSLTKAGTDDIILKKVVLTGTPFKVRRKLATVRHMFLDPKDILWFKPVELHTKLGLVGHIREPLGTHGYMKCIFNEQLSMQDEVRLALYKRVYPHKVTEEEKQSFV